MRKLHKLVIFLFCFELSISVCDAKSQKRKAIKNIQNSENIIYLTFDDGPSKVVTEKILDILDKHNVKATFFEIGEKIKATPELSKMCVDRGHEVGNHSMTHPKLPKLGSLAKIQLEIEENQDLIGEVTGIRPTAFRAPFLKFDERVWSVLDQNSLKAYNASAYCDFKKKSSIEQHPVLAANMVKAGTIILIHERTSALNFLNEFIEELKSRDFVFKTISEIK